MENSFGDYLKELRLSRNMSINQLAEESGISNSQISRIENGLRGIPKPETIRKIADALKVEYEVLMNEAGYLPDKKDINTIIETGKQYIDKARSDALISSEFLDETENMLKRVIEIDSFIENNPNIDVETKFNKYLELQGYIENAIYGMERINKRVLISMNRSQGNGQVPENLRTISLKYLNLANVQLNKIRPFRNNTKSENDEADYDIIVDLWLDDIIPYISFDESRFFPVVKEEIDDILFEVAPEIRDQIEITPQGLPRSLKSIVKSDSKIVDKILNPLRLIGFRYKANAIDNPSSKKYTLDLEKWLKEGSIMYHNIILNEDQKQHLLRTLSFMVQDDTR
ncbi:helix-turn-helix transcriptional regulator [Paenibacillus sp. MWE-103]|uniref:Helix-turn-helix transcriptional regulator n=1 Tax=Paenibacillus artemisiicola TaxID=1172618 RepID=A0ABS3W7B1_9BACL|nr:helix-turn-helix transcriptional regulator [Paenibacillus artemisiicola]